MITLDQLLPLGTIRKPHGKQGEMVLGADNDLLELFEPHLLVLTIDGINVPFEVEELRTKGQDYLLKLEDVDSEGDVRKLVNAPCYALRREVPEQEHDRVVVATLIGFTLIDQKRGEMGKIKDIDDSTINTLMLLDNGLVLPLHDDFIEDIDTEQHSITVSLPEGLVDDMTSENQ